MKRMMILLWMGLSVVWGREEEREMIFSRQSKDTTTRSSRILSNPTSGRVGKCPSGLCETSPLSRGPTAPPRGQRSEHTMTPISGNVRCHTYDVVLFIISHAATTFTTIGDPAWPQDFAWSPKEYHRKYDCVSAGQYNGGYWCQHKNTKWLGWRTRSSNDVDENARCVSVSVDESLCLDPGTLVGKTLRWFDAPEDVDDDRLVCNSFGVHRLCAIGTPVECSEGDVRECYCYRENLKTKLVDGTETCRRVTKVSQRDGTSITRWSSCKCSKDVIDPDESSLRSQTNVAVVSFWIITLLMLLFLTIVQAQQCMARLCDACRRERHKRAGYQKVRTGDSHIVCDSLRKRRMGPQRKGAYIRVRTSEDN